VGAKTYSASVGTQPCQTCNGPKWVPVAMPNTAQGRMFHGEDIGQKMFAEG
jgi:hypothetical protein